MQKHSKWNIKNSLKLALFTSIIFLLVNLFGFMFPHVFLIWDNQINDRLFRLRTQVKESSINPFIVHIDMNDSTVINKNISVYDRSVYSKAINFLKQVDVDSVVLDIIFAEDRNSYSDRMLVESLEDINNIYFPVIPQSSKFTNLYNLPKKTESQLKYMKEHLWYPKVVRKGKPIVAEDLMLNFFSLQSALNNMGHIAVEPDRDGVYRRVPLVIKYKDGYIPFISFKAVCDYLNVDDSNIIIKFGSYILLKDASSPFGEVRDIKIPIDNQGNLKVNFVGRWNNSFPHFSMEDFLSTEDEKVEDLKEVMSDSIVIVSTVTTRGKDHGTVPIEKVFPLAGIHSNLINSILENEFVINPGSFSLLLLNVILILLLVIAGIKFRTVTFSVVSLFVFVFIQILNIILFILFNLQINIVAPSTAYVMSYIFISFYRYISEEKFLLNHVIALHDAASHFVPKEFLRYLKRGDISEIQLGDQVEKEMTILFSDIRAFTTLSETMTPEENFNFLNSYLKNVGPVIREYGGFIDKYIGDAIMALFDDKPEYCVRSAIELKQKLGEFNEKRVLDGDKPINVGIGIHTGRLMLGIIGENKRYEGSVISDSVNLSSRLEGLTKVYGVDIIISEDVFFRLEDPTIFNYKLLDYVKVKGKKKPVAIYEVFDGLKEGKVEVKKKTKPKYERAFSYYIHEDFKGALSLYEEILSEYEDEKTALLFKERCEKYILEGVPDEWDGASQIYV